MRTATYPTRLAGSRIAVSHGTTIMLETANTPIIGMYSQRSAIVISSGTMLRTGVNATRNHRPKNAKACDRVFHAYQAYTTAIASRKMRAAQNLGSAADCTTKCRAIERSRGKKMIFRYEYSSYGIV